MVEFVTLREPRVGLAERTRRSARFHQVADIVLRPKFRNSNARTTPLLDILPGHA